MSEPAITPEERFAALVEAFRGDPDVTLPSERGESRRRFGAGELKTSGRIFAMLSRGRLVVKLPRSRVDALIASGDGEPYDPRHDGRIMKEWVAIPPSSIADWLLLAREALTFVGPQR